MAKYVALLRAINVGGHSIIKMSELRELCVSFGFSKVATHIQTGNIIFESKLTAGQVQKLLEDKLSAKMDYKIVAFVKTPAQIRDIASAKPFTPTELSDDYKRYVTFISAKLDDTQRTLLVEKNNDFQAYHAGDQVIYTSLRKDSPKPIFDNLLIEKILGVSATTRNWAVVQKLAELATA